ncbi:RNA binding protein, heterogenous nuclear RNP-K like protein [Coemansia sp. RSA 2711]|nr:RNA binding protein, heterogenous nuclear RNP-K like protein [Coemansia sp. RSA 2711]
MAARRDSKTDEADIDIGYAVELASGAPASETPRVPESEAEQRPMLRLIFSHEDGGVLIGKSGRHITKLKESTTASWFVSRSNETIDRLVVLRGSVDELANAVFALAQHLGQQADRSRPSDAGAQPVTLRFLFPSGAIGSILGIGGGTIAKKRAELNVSWLHVFHEPIPFTNERIIETSGSAAALQAVAKWLLLTTLPDLEQLQQMAAPYCPVSNGLRRMLLQERQRSSSEQRSPTSRHSSSASNYTVEPRLTRKRSHSSFGPDEYRPAADNARDERKRSRRSSEENERHGHSARPRYHHDHQSPTTETIVVPDNMAGRLIGRNGNHLALLRERSGAHIEMSQRVPHAVDRTVTISGRPSQVSSACKLVRDSLRIFKDLAA